MFPTMIGTVVIAGIIGYLSAKTELTHNGILQSIIICIGGAFVFARTPEGFAYWNEIDEPKSESTLQHYFTSPNVTTQDAIKIGKFLNKIDSGSFDFNIDVAKNSIKFIELLSDITKVSVNGDLLQLENQFLPSL